MPFGIWAKTNLKCSMCGKTLWFDAESDGKLAYCEDYVGCGYSEEVEVIFVMVVRK